MKVVIVLLLAAYASANVELVQDALDNGLHPFSAQMVDIINQNAKTWKAKQHFTEKDLNNVKIKLGAILNHDIELDPINETSHFNMSAEIPKEFDPRIVWPKCQPIIDDIRDQANCGSCWSISTVGAISDRICIASEGKQLVKISGNDLMSCCNLFSSFSFCGFGCNGGIPSLAWRYYKSRGIVSGGNYGENETCSPYKLKPCGHHVKDNPCKGMARTPKCQKSCVNNANYKQDKHYASKTYSLKGAESIQREIMQYGSVEAGFTVYSDFPQYESGVYQATSNSPLGNHAVRIIGWGEDKESGLPYWLIANSWNNDWGLKGYFKMIRGKDHCGIESQVNAGLPKL